MRVVWILVVIFGVAVGFGAGFLTATHVSKASQDVALKQNLLKQLLATEAGFEVGLTVADLRTSEKQVTVAFDLAGGALSQNQKTAAKRALHAIGKTLAAWDETLTHCHAGRGGYVGLSENTDAEGNWDPNCNNRKLEAMYRDLGVLPELTKWTAHPLLTLAPKRGVLLQPLFNVTVDRIETAVRSLGGSAPGIRG